MFDADKYLEAVSPPSITIDGETYTGRLLGFDDWLRFQERFDQVEARQLELSGIHTLARDLCEALQLPADKVLALPIGAVIEALGDFLRSHFAALPERPASTSESEG